MTVKNSGNEERFNLTSPRQVRQLLDKYGLTAKKSLGQNFLIDANILRKILQAAEILPSDVVLEIGVGVGALTGALAERAQAVVAVETDRSLLPLLNEVLADKKNVTLIFEDILKLDLTNLLAGADTAKVVANLPYYITTPIIFHLLKSNIKWGIIVLMIQKEVAERIVSPPGGKNYGALSVMVQHYASAEIMGIVPPTVFLPRPKVESAILRLKPRDIDYPDDVEEVFSLLVRTVFAFRRKNLVNSLKGIIPKLGGEERVRAALKIFNIDPEERGENLSPEEFFALASLLR